MALEAIRAGRRGLDSVLSSDRGLSRAERSREQLLQTITSEGHLVHLVHAVLDLRSQKSFLCFPFDFYG